MGCFGVDKREPSGKIESRKKKSRCTGCCRCRSYTINQRIVFFLLLIIGGSILIDRGRTFRHEYRSGFCTNIYTLHTMTNCCAVRACDCHTNCDGLKGCQEMADNLEPGECCYPTFCAAHRQERRCEVFCESCNGTLSKYEIRDKYGRLMGVMDFDHGCPNDEYQADCIAFNQEKHVVNATTHCLYKRNSTGDLSQVRLDHAWHNETKKALWYTFGTLMLFAAFVVFCYTWVDIYERHYRRREYRPAGSRGNPELDDLHFTNRDDEEDEIPINKFDNGILISNQ